MKTVARALGWYLLSVLRIVGYLGMFLFGAIGVIIAAELATLNIWLGFAAFILLLAAMPLHGHAGRHRRGH